MASLDSLSVLKPGSERGQRFNLRVDKLRFIGIILLYPGFFFYHFGVALGMPAILGGYYGVVVLFLFPALGIFFLYGVHRGYTRINRLDTVLCALFIYCLAWALVHRIFGQQHQADQGLFIQSISGLVIWITNYLLFRSESTRSNRRLLVLTAAGLGMLAVAWVNQDEGVFIARQLSDASVQETVATYQGFARSAVIVLFFLMAWADRRWLMPLYYTGLVLLFLLSARSEFGGFLVVGFALLVIRFGAGRFLLFSLPALLIGSSILFNVAQGISDNSRIFRLMGWEEDTSLASRLEMSDQAWRTILSHPLTGDYGSHLAGGMGAYAHNMLSVWADFGLIGFLGFSYLLLSSNRISFASVRSGARDGDSFMAFSLAFLSLILALTAKSMFFPLFGASWGAAAGLLEWRSRNKGVLKSGGGGCATR